MSVNGMKQDVCVVEPDQLMPAVRSRAAFGHESASSPRTSGATSYLFNSKRTNASPCSPPRAHASTPRLSRSSPAIPPRFSSSVQVSEAQLGMYLLMKDAIHETDAD